MLDKRSPLFSVIAFAAVFGSLVVVAPLFAASKENVLQRFPYASLRGGLIMDAAGNVYGTTVYANDSCGTVFELKPGENGKWKQKTLYLFGTNGPTDACRPYGSLIFDPEGNLYGTTLEGGTQSYGTVFELTRGTKGNWTEKVLYNFCSASACKDGVWPFAGLIFDSVGTLYGTTSSGGTYGSGGTVFKLTRGGGGNWTETVLHSFRKYGDHASGPLGGLVSDASGNLYGTTYAGGIYRKDCDPSQLHCGTAFELKRGKNGKWREIVLHRFRRKDGANPGSGLIFGATGSLYGTTFLGGTGPCKDDNGIVLGCGTVFSLTPVANGKWVEKVLHNFDDDGKDGYSPLASLIFDAAGNSYGTTESGGTGNGGTVFSLIQKANGKWKEVIVHSFAGTRDGALPTAGLIFDPIGNLYGTTSSCGNENCQGTVFEITP
jgi:hypothetical protein